MLALAVLCSLATSPAGGAVAGRIALTSLAEPVDLQGEWLFAPGDDVLRASPAFDDSTWAPIAVPKGMGAQGFADLTGPFWYRLHVRAPPPAATDQIAVLIADVDSAYEIYADGVPIGGRGSIEGAGVDDNSHAGLWRLPRDALDDGEVVLAVRGMRLADRQSSNPGRGGIAHGPNLIGPTDTLARGLVMRDLDEWVLSGAFLFVGLYHLQLFRRRRALREYLWFGAFSVFVSMYVLTQVALVHDVLPAVASSRYWFFCIFGCVATFLQFAWPFLGVPIRWWWRAWQAVAAAWCFLGVVWPTQWFIHRLLLPWELVVLLPFLVGIVSLIVGKALRGDPEARTILFGTALMVATSINNILRTLGWQTPEVTNWAFAGFVLSMAVSLSNRFTRVHREVDELLAKTLRLSKLKDEFLANTSHELRTPLNAIINLPRGLLEQIAERDVIECRSCGALFDDDEGDGAGDACPSCGESALARTRRRLPPDDAEELARHLGTIAGSGEHLLAVVSDILDASKLSSGAMELTRERVPLGDVVKAALATVAQDARARSVELRTKVDLACTVNGDRERLTQIVTNLVSNAVKFSPKGGVVDVEAAVAVAGEAVELRVIDRGAGIAREHHALIFEAFRQVDAGHTRKHGGTGLGLAIAKQLAELHGGTLVVDSELGKGATFTLRLRAS